MYAAKPRQCGKNEHNTFRTSAIPDHLCLSLWNSMIWCDVSKKIVKIQEPLEIEPPWSRPKSEDNVINRQMFETTNQSRGLLKWREPFVLMIYAEAWDLMYGKCVKSAEISWNLDFPGSSSVFPKCKIPLLLKMLLNSKTFAFLRFCVIFLLCNWASPVLEPRGIWNLEIGMKNQPFTFFTRTANHRLFTTIL